MTNYYANKKVLITGHTGFKGSWLSYWLINLNAKVSGYSIDIPTSPSLYEQLELAKYLSFDFREDILDFPSLYKCVQLVKPDIIFHLAAQPIVSKSYKNPLGTFSTNFIGSLNLFEVLRKYAIPSKVIFITSDKCYENNEWIYGYREIDQLGGKDPYSASKACAEIGLRSLALSFPERSFKLATARAGNVVGGGDWSLDRIVPDCMRKWSAFKAVTLRSPRASRPWQHVLEPLSGYLKLAENLDKKQSLDSNAFNFGPISKSDVSVLDICNLLAKHWPDAKINIDSAQSIGSECGLLKLDVSKASSLLNWSPNLSLEECTSITSKWYYNLYNGKSAKELCLADIDYYTKKMELKL